MVILPCMENEEVPGGPPHFLLLLAFLSVFFFLLCLIFPEGTGKVMDES